ncbi:MAG: hypothetical protein WA071_26775 [Undibacterium umbellatum]|uniref:hypothetical protein n=1 Tax=Undibacterium umbellatum TaxID=2762300 RepID=UPI003BB7F4B0
MPGSSLGGNVLSGQFSASAGDMASVAGSGRLDAGLSAEFNRGVELSAQINAQVGLSAEFSHFISAGVTGEAHASASIQAQIQAPMNLFDEAGLFVRLKAAAEVGAGVQLAIGLSAREFLEQAANIPGMGSLPLRLVKVLLDEVVVQGGVHAQVAVSAMAYANTVVGFQLVETSKGGVVQKPGFYVGAEAGAGLEAGAGFRVFAQASLSDPRRMVRRSIDLLADEALSQLADMVRAQSPAVAVSIDAARSPLKMALRLCYELGDLSAQRIKTGQTGFTTNDSGQMALRTLQIIIDEAQRYICSQVCEAAVTLLSQQISAIGVSATTWQSARVQREAFAAQLRAIPDEPFEATTINRTYWSDLVNKGASLLAALLNTQQRQSIAEPIAMLWAGSQLLFAVMERIAPASASATFLGRSVSTPAPSFSGSNLQQPPTLIRQHILTALNKPVTQTLVHADLVAYLTRASGLTNLRQRQAGLNQFLSIFESVMPSNLLVNSAAELFLKGEAAFVPNGGTFNPERALLPLTNALRAFVDNQINAVITPAVRNLGRNNDDVVVYWREVCVPSLNAATQMVFAQVESWSRQQFSEKAFQEALSSILLTFLGRNLVVFADVITHSARSQMRRMLNQAADNAGAPNGLANTLRPVTGGSADELADLLEEVLRIGGEVFGPLPPEQRQRMRSLMFRAIQPISLENPGTLIQNLSNPAMVPDPQLLAELGLAMGSLMVEQFLDFVGRVLARVAQMILDALSDAVEALTEAVQQWLTDIGNALEDARERVQAIARELREALDAMQDHVQDEAEAFTALITQFSRRKTRMALLDGISNHVYDQVASALHSIPGYDWLPSWMRKSVRQTLRGVIENLIESEVMDDLLETLRTDQAEANRLLRDVRALRGRSGYTRKLLDLMLDWAIGRLQERLRDGFVINIRFTVFDNDFNLGEIALGVSDLLLGVLRALLEGVADIVDAVGELSDKALAALAAENLLESKQAEVRVVEETEARLTALHSESRPQSRRIEIMEPANGAFCGDTPDFEIHLYGVPLSFIKEDEGGRERVALFLNGQELELNQFSIREFAATSTESVRSTTPLDINAIGRSVKSKVPFTLAQNFSATVLNQSLLKAQREKTASKTISRTITGGMLKRPALANVDLASGGLGRLRRVDLGAIRNQNDAEAGIVLTRRVKSTELQQGINTLVVVVADGHGVALRSTASFLSPPQTKAPVTPSHPRDPSRPSKLPASSIEDLRAWLPNAEHIKRAVSKGRDINAAKPRVVPRIPTVSTAPMGWSAAPPFALFPLKQGALVRGRIIAADAKVLTLALGPGVIGKLPVQNPSPDQTAVPTKTGQILYVEVVKISKAEPISLKLAADKPRSLVVARPLSPLKWMAPLPRRGQRL